MISYFLSLTTGAILITTCLFILRLLKCDIWRIQLLVKSWFPNIPFIVCTLSYYITCIYLIFPVILSLLYIFYLGPFLLDFSFTQSTYQALFFIRIYGIFVQHIYTNSIQFNVGKNYRFLKWFNTVLFFSYQAFICVFLLNFDSASNAAIFLGLNTSLYLNFVSARQPGRKILFEDFCMELIKFLEDTDRARPQQLQLLREHMEEKEEKSSEMSSIPDERLNEIHERDKSCGQNLMQGYSKIAPLNLDLINDQSISSSHAPNPHHLLPQTHTGFCIDIKQTIIKNSEASNKIIDLTSFSGILLSKFGKPSSYKKIKKLMTVLIYFVTLGIYGMFQL